MWQECVQYMSLVSTPGDRATRGLGSIPLRAVGAQSTQLVVFPFRLINKLWPGGKPGESKLWKLECPAWPMSIYPLKAKKEDAHWYTARVLHFTSYPANSLSLSLTVTWKFSFIFLSDLNNCVFDTQIGRGYLVFIQLCLPQFNWYTKRGILAAVYKSTELCMLQDKSQDFQVWLARPGRPVHNGPLSCH